MRAAAGDSASASSGSGVIGKAFCQRRRAVLKTGIDMLKKLIFGGALLSATPAHADVFDRLSSYFNFHSTKLSDEAHAAYQRAHYKEALPL